MTNRQTYRQFDLKKEKNSFFFFTVTTRPFPIFIPFRSVILQKTNPPARVYHVFFLYFFWAFFFMMDKIEVKLKSLKSFVFLKHKQHTLQLLHTHPITSCPEVINDLPKRAELYFFFSRFFQEKNFFFLFFSLFPFFLSAHRVWFFGLFIRSAYRSIFSNTFKITHTLFLVVVVVVSVVVVHLPFFSSYKKNPFSFSLSRRRPPK